MRPDRDSLEPILRGLLRALNDQRLDVLAAPFESQTNVLQSRKQAGASRRQVATGWKQGAAHIWWKKADIDGEFAGNVCSVHDRHTRNQPEEVRQPAHGGSVCSESERNLAVLNSGAEGRIPASFYRRRSKPMTSLGDGQYIHLHLFHLATNDDVEPFCQKRPEHGLKHRGVRMLDLLPRVDRGALRQERLHIEPIEFDPWRSARQQTR